MVSRQEVLDYIVDFIKDWTPQGKKCLVLFGDIGVGKTYIVKQACSKLGIPLDILDEYTIDFGDREQVLRYVSSRSLFSPKRVILLDRPHQFLSFQDIKKIIRASKHPVIIEIDTDSIKYYKHLMCAEAYVVPPKKSDIVKLVKEKAIPGIKPNYKAISSDVRQSLLTVYGSQGYSSSSFTDRVEHFFKTGEASGLDISHLPIIIDTAPRAYQGLRLVELIRLVLAADLLKDSTILEGLKPNKPTINISYYFYERVKALREAEKK